MANAGKRKSGEITPPVNEVLKRYYWSTSDSTNNNRYQVLDTDNEVSQKNDSTNGEASSSQDKPSSVTPKIPPIFIHNATTSNHKEIIRDIKAIANDEFTTELKNTYLKVNLKKQEHYRALSKYYMTNMVQFHTFQNPNDKPLSVIIRNVPISLTEDEIKQELEELKYPVKSVTRLMNRDKHPIPICAVILPSNDVSNNILQLEYLANCKVTVEIWRKQHHIPQCHNCQQYGHTKNYCAAKPRCVKCNQDHHTKDCKKDSNTKPYCVNCQGNGHPASYRGCPHHVMLQKQRTPFNKSRQATNQNIIRSNTTYLQATTQKLHPQNQSLHTDNTSPLTDNISQIIIQLITPIIEQIKSYIINNLLPNILNGK